MIYGLNFNGTRLPPQAKAFPETIAARPPNKAILRIVGMTNDPDAVRQMMIVATNGKRILTTQERVVLGATWWAVYAA